ncbi:glycerophosphodiester phosphodiesterase [Flavobacterium hydatis]|uniref:glycerophosphodiester phosphodiesterase n=1 Tax=Flavobacterium hydatis TaxID=991 RepID=A0A086AT73_FLAHY|nr:glycerophosphodiester phosphodiesterase [Flavobacterium hydatis]KFF19887.1 glycerophosphodiester phosphodiesterase [Flavobacterium hydatis]OXA91547.1 glycerophosphodiester phosphodiesterase [Flavobacterium hydatis]
MNSFQILKSTIFLSAVILLLACDMNDDDNQTPETGKYPTLTGANPIVVAHRGASGYLPEHTIEGYTKAIEMGADFIEPDLVMTKDGQLVVRHEPMLSGTTNVSEIPAFASKKTTKNIDGAMVSDWFVSDFTLAEIKQLKAKQAFAERSQQYNNLYAIPTFAEVIALAKQKSAQLGRVIGIYPETKHPSFHEALNLKITDKLLEMLTAEGWNNASSPVYVQSFEVSNLQYIRTKSTVKTIQLLSCYDVALNGDLIFTVPQGEIISDGKPYDWYLKGDTRDYGFFRTQEGLDFVKTYATGIGPWKPFIISYKGVDANNDGKADDINADGKVDDADKVALPPTTLISDAHKKGLQVHAYTFRNEGKRLLSNYKNNPTLEYQAFYKLGLDGVFSDFTDTAVQAR